MPKFILSILLLILALQPGSASTVTVGFENLQSVCGYEDYNGCQIAHVNPYQQSLGLTFSGGTITRNLNPNPYGFQSIFPFGQYYLNVDLGGGAEVTLNFLNPDNTARMMTHVEFVVLGKNGDIITGPYQRQGAGGTSSTVPENLNNRTCNVPWECDGYRSGLEGYAMNGRQLQVDAIVDPIWYGEAGYNTSDEDFANFRVVLSVSPDKAFSSIKLKPTLTRDWAGNPVWGMIAIDQITFEQAVPEPGTFALPGLVLAGAVWYQRRRAKAGKAA